LTIKEFEIQYALGSLSIDDLRRLAQNSNTSKRVLTILIKDPYWNIPYYVVANPNTPIDIIVELALTKPWWGRDMPVRNPNIPKDILPEDKGHKGWWLFWGKEKTVDETYRINSVQ